MVCCCEPFVKNKTITPGTFLILVYMKRFLLLFFLFVLRAGSAQELKKSINAFDKWVDIPAQCPGDSSVKSFFYIKLIRGLNLDLEGLGPGCVRFFLRFVICEDGTVHEATISTRHESRDQWNQELQRVMNQIPAWKPALKNGKPVKCYFNIPIYIRLG